MLASYNRLAFVALPLLLAAACADDVASPALVEDLRVLAVRAEPPELLFERDDLIAGAPRSVRFEALVVDPRGLPMIYDWQFCPVESSETCADFERRRATAPAGYAGVLDEARAQAATGMAMPAPEGIAAMAGFDISVTPPLFGYHLLSSALGLGNGGWSSAVLTLNNGTESLSAQKRVVLGARDLSAFNPELAAAGIAICVAGAETPGCLPLRPRVANRNPEIAGVELARGASAATPFSPLAGPVALLPGEKVRLRPVVAPDAEEPFQTIESTLQDSRLFVADHREALVVSWFATAGKFDEPQTALQLSKGIDNLYTAPDASARGKSTTIFIVVRDQRGGVGWSRVDATVM